ncbi:MAG: DMT family transporter [Chloroflexota bacterium]
MDIRTLAALAITLVFWASAFAGIRAGLEAYSPGHLALLRFLVASIVLAAYALATRMRLPDRRDLPAIALAGFLGIAVYHTALNYGELTVTAGSAALLLASAPMFTALLATITLRERVSTRGWAGLMLSFAGVALIALGEGNTFDLDLGALLVLAAALSTAFYNVVQKPYLAKYSALEFTTYAIWSGTLFTLVFTPGLVEQVRQAPLAPTLSVVYLGVFPAALAYTTWTYVVSRMPVSRAVSGLYLSPALAIFIAWVWLGEIPTLLSLVGGGVALAGVILVGTQRPAARSDAGDYSARSLTHTIAPPSSGIE